VKVIFSALAGIIAASALPVSAGGAFTSTIRDSNVISVQGAGLQMTRMGSEFSASGYGTGTVSVTPGTCSSNCGANDIPLGTTAYTTTSTDGTPFSLDGSSRAADAVGQSFSVGTNTGTATSLNLYGEVLIQYAGTVGADTSMTMPMLGTTTTGPTSITTAAGQTGPSIVLDAAAQGVTAISAREIELSIFR
jgi:hypothetical protein